MFLIDRISPQFWSILILESVFILFTPQNNSLLSAFHLVCAFMGLISKVYFGEFYMCISSSACFECLHNKQCFNGKVYFFSYLIIYESFPSGFKNKTHFLIKNLNFIHLN